MMNSKRKTRDELSKIVAELKKKGKTGGLTSGSFDIIHAGHATYLEAAKEKCDVLIVGVNSDLSVKKYKGEDRPIIPEKERITLMAALSSVDYVFMFDERRNKNNIEVLKPDFYIKAGDYKKSELTSAKYLEPYGGHAILIPPVKGISTSEITRKIIHIHENSSKKNHEWNDRPVKSAPAVFVDRDGTINKEIHFLHEPEKFEILDGVVEGLKLIQDMHYRIIIVTNQQGIGLGYFTKEDLFRVNSKMLKIVSNSDIKIDKIYFCPHSLG